MEMSFIVGLILLMGITVCLAPKIVRKKIQFFTYALIVLAFYAALFLLFRKDSFVFANIACLCLCCTGLVLLLIKMKQHGPNSISSEDVKIMSPSQLAKYKKMKAQKIDFYKEWWLKVVLVNIFAAVAILLISSR